MGHLTVVGGRSSGAPFSMNSHGIAAFKLATRVGARRIVEAYAFPDEGKPRIITPWPAKELVYEYFRYARAEERLTKVILDTSEPKPVETRSEKSKHTSLLRAAKHLKAFGPTLEFQEVRRRPLRTTIARLPVRASLDFVASLESKKGGMQRLGVIYNVATEVSSNADKMKIYAQIETEIALRVLREQTPNIDAVWYVDLLSEKIVVRKSKPHAALWREIETVCDDILMVYRSLMARRVMGKEHAT